ncbi:TIGR02186 family protein [uncultured Cohaesibacter sp.]|uniref:TIGR02186 family protein n=1 Tax=uncultured Cohaesibacter sp. TaxID=1002546 RepID=UPI002AAC4474|nr:TIGR02186 family protein [uncultured Cohaesibacter sp.]
MIPSRLSRTIFGARLLLWLGVCMGGTIHAAHSERIVADLSERVIKISSNFTGSDIVIFGTIERDRATVSRGEPYDLVVVVRGWDQTLVSRRKERTFGIWINQDRRLYSNAPNFYAMSTTRKLVDIAHPSLLAKLQIGTRYLLLPPTFNPQDRFATYDPFRVAALRQMREKGLYTDDPSSVTFLSKSLFRSTIPIPSNVEVGEYEVTVHLLRGGALLHSSTQKLHVAKTGFEQHAFTLARDHEFFYGLTCVLIALFTGWLTGVVFRKN